MSRGLDSTIVSQLTGSYIRLAIFAQLTFVSTTEYVWTGVGNISWNGQTWKGIGDLASISTIVEDSTLTAQSLVLTLRFVRSDLVGEVNTEVKPGLPAKLWLVFFNASGYPIDSVMSYAGLMDQPQIEEDPTMARVAISLENRLSDLQRAQYRRLTDQDQRLKYPSDSGLLYVNEMQDWNGQWTD